MTAKYAMLWMLGGSLPFCSTPKVSETLRKPAAISMYLGQHSGNELMRQPPAFC